jgi:DnaJ-class molecular chaperone
MALVCLFCIYNITVIIKKEEKKGGEIKMSTTIDQPYQPCGACGGKGYQHNIQTGINERCPMCGGSGMKYVAPSIIC